MGINSYRQADFDAQMAELDRLIGSRTPVVYAPQPRAETLLDRVNAVGKIASKSNEHKAGKPIEAQALSIGLASVCPVRQLGTSRPL